MRGHRFCSFWIWSMCQFWGVPRPVMRLWRFPVIRRFHKLRKASKCLSRSVSFGGEPWSTECALPCEVLAVPWCECCVSDMSSPPKSLAHPQKKTTKTNLIQAYPSHIGTEKNPPSPSIDSAVLRISTLPMLSIVSLNVAVRAAQNIRRNGEAWQTQIRWRLTRRRIEEPHGTFWNPLPRPPRPPLLYVGTKKAYIRSQKRLTFLKG